MPASEIDAIFAGTAGTSKVTDPERVTPASSKSKKKRKRKVEEDGRREAGEGSTKYDGASSSSTNVEKTTKKKMKPRKAETIVDPSKAIFVAQTSTKQQKKLKTKLTDDIEEFRDTRGKSRRRTEDGLPIYSFDELGIDENSGGTPLCPFDCDCCH